MKLRSTIFGSKAEAELFHSLQSHWSPKLTLYPSLPLANIIQIDPKELSPGQLEYFYKTSVDYTFCQANGLPILSIEFDGIGGGFSRDGTYMQVREAPDPYRKLKIDFKLKAAATVNYPLIVVSYEEKESLDREDSLTILDGIVGQLLAQKEFIRHLNEMIEVSKTEIEGLQRTERGDYIEHLITAAEVKADSEMNPIARKADDYHVACISLGVTNYRFEYLHDPPLPSIKDVFDLEGLRTRINAMKHTLKIGCKIVVNTPKNEIIKVAWVRNFEGYGIFPGLIAENIARYLVFKKAYSLLTGMKRKASDSNQSQVC